MFSWFKRRKRLKLMKALEANCFQEGYDSLCTNVEALRESVQCLELLAEKTRAELSWQEERHKSIQKMLLLLQEMCDFDIEYVSEHNLFMNKKERKMQLAKDGYSFFSCVEGDEVWRRRKQ